jgi:hypothetical protein
MNIDREKFMAAVLALGLGGGLAACGGDAEPVEEEEAPPLTTGSEDYSEPMMDTQAIEEPPIEQDPLPPPTTE